MVAVYITPCEEAREVWKPIPGHPGYEVSNMGRVRSYYRPGINRLHATACVLQVRLDRCGYPVVYVRKRYHKVHRLVMLVFAGPSDLHVLHGDGIKNNNRLANLRYGTDAENKQDSARLGEFPKGEGKTLAKLNDDKVRDIRRRAALGEPQASIAASMGVSRSAVEHVVCGRQWRHVV